MSEGVRMLLGGVVVLFAVLLVVLIVAEIIPTCDKQVEAYQQDLSQPGNIVPPKFVALSMCSDEIQAKY